MLPVMNVHSLGIGQPDGTVRYRTDAAGERIVILPATCKRGRHSLAATGYRAIMGDGELHIRCTACAADLDLDCSWRLIAIGPSPERAELDDEPYVDVVPRPQVHPRRR